MRETLELLANLADQCDYEADASTANVPAELVCFWFDESYSPDSGEFVAAFSRYEFEILAGFNAFFAERVDGLPTEHGVAVLHESAEWKEIVVRAAQTLVALAWHV